MQVKIKAQEDEYFKLITKESEEILDDFNVSSVTPEPIAEECGQTATIPNVVERRQPTLNNPSGHEWFNGTSWGLK